MILGSSIRGIVKKNPIELFRILKDVSLGKEELDDECYFEILRTRRSMRMKPLVEAGFTELLRDIFAEGCAYKFIQLLTEHELLCFVFPAIDTLRAVDGGHYHNELVYTHVCGALKALDKNTKLPWFVKFAALYHDVGKCTWEISDEGKRRFLNHAQGGVPLTVSDMARLGFTKDEIKTVSTLVGMHMQQLDQGHSMRKLKRIFTEANVNPKYFFWVRYADNKGSAVYKTDFMYYWNLYKQYLTATRVVQEPSVKDLCINGYDLMKKFNKPPGKWIGAVLTYLFKGVQERGYINEPNELLEHATEFVKWYTGE